MLCNLVKMDFIKLLSKKVSLRTGIETEGIEIGTGSKDFEQYPALPLCVLALKLNSINVNGCEVCHCVNFLLLFLC